MGCWIRTDIVYNTQFRVDFINNLDKILLNSKTNSKLNSKLNSKFKLLYYLYDEDVLDEDSIIMWYNTFKPIEGGVFDTKFNVDFIQWLQTAEEDSDSN